MRKKIVFRADGNSEVGLGHLYRTVSLMEMLKDEYELLLLTRQNSDYQAIFKNFEVDIIPLLPIEEEIVYIANNFKSQDVIFVLDGYEFNDSYQKTIKGSCNKVVYIDDFGKKYKNANLVINHSPVKVGDNFFVEKNTSYALGTKYSILRPLFLKEAKKEVDEPTNKRVLVSFGGADFNNLTQRTLDILEKIEGIERVNVILGSSYPFELQYNSEKVKIYRGLSEAEMLACFQENDRIIVPSSTVLYEAVSCKKYILTGFYIDNQKLIYDGFTAAKSVISVDDFMRISDEEYEKELRRLINYQDKELLENQHKMIDGKSKNRIIELIKKIN